MFEKFDGVRGFWNPYQKAFFSRSGKPFLFPSHITSLMPNLMLDGELW
jgi:ATP-dependent DNA ligase